MRFLVLFILFFITIIAKDAYSQQNTERQRPQQSTDASIRGRVVEKQTGNPVEFANIVVHSLQDSSIVSGGITDKDGFFEINRIYYGKFFVKVQFIGFGEHIIPEITINQRNNIVNLGTIQMELSAEMLDEVSVEAYVDRVEYRLDRRVVNVSRDISAAGGSAVDALQNVPGVQTDIDDNVSLRGTESFLVLIDGRPSPLGGSEALQQIPAESIESIEIITNPSARYDPEGVGGIINVIMKKDRRTGYNAQVSANYGSFNSFGGDFLVNIRKENINFFIGGNYNENINRGVGRETRNSYLKGDTVFSVFSENDRQRIRNSGTARIGMDYYFNDNEIITVSGRFNTFTFGRNLTTTAQTFLSSGNETFGHYNYLTETESRSNWHSFQGDINYFKKFSENGQTLQVYAGYWATGRDQLNIFTEQEIDLLLNPVEESSINETRTIDGGPGSRININIDYEHPIQDNFKLETGYHVNLSEMSNEYKFQYLINENWIDDPNMHNPYVFNQNIQSGYILFSNSPSNQKLGYMVGLRTEYTDRLFKQTSTEEEWPYKSFDFFPSAHVSYKLPADMELMASYSRRLQRPRPWTLNPFVDVEDPNNRRRGNPLLRPEFTNSFELNLQKRFGNNFISLEGYYRESYDRIERQLEVDPDNPDIFIATFQNIGESLATGGEMMTNLNLYRWWNLNLTGSVYYYEIIDINSTVTWNSRINNTFRIQKTGTSIQLSGSYTGPSITSQGRREAFYMVNGAVRQDFFDRQLTVNLAVSDIFNTMGHEVFFETPSFDSHLIRERRGPTFRLTLTYRIRDFQPRRDRRPDNDMNGGDDII